ncbi:beta-lactamase family protein [Mycoplasmatota bacterium]|nr:beta-lactamase family protein [Mycoplasmatota bacterium]
MVDYKNLSDYIDIKKHHRALAILKVKNDEIVYEDYLNTNENNLFNIASISKFLIGLIIHRLQVNNKLSIEDKVEDYLDDFPYHLIKIKHLLYHESGIIDYYRLFEDEALYKVTNKIALDRVYQEPISVLPGTKFEYSNTNYVILYEIISKIKNKSFTEILREELKIPLEGFKEYKSHRKDILELLPSYDEKDKSILDSLTLGDGGFLANIHFFKLLIPWLHSQIQPSFFSVHKDKLNDDFSEHYEYGITVSPKDSIAFHYGMYMGYRSLFCANYQTKTSMMIMSNSSECTYDLRKRIMEELIE